MIRRAAVGQFGQVCSNRVSSGVTRTTQLHCVQMGMCANGSFLPHDNANVLMSYLCCLAPVCCCSQDVNAYQKLRVERMNARVQGLRLKKVGGLEVACKGCSLCVFLCLKCDAETPVSLVWCFVCACFSNVFTVDCHVCYCRPRMPPRRPRPTHKLPLGFFHCADQMV